MVKLWRCDICGDPYVGEAPPENCPFCGAHKSHIRKARLVKAEFNVSLSGKDLDNVRHAIEVEASNSAFYFCAAGKTDDAEGALLFKALGKIEAEHANIWRKMLKLASVPKADEQCSSRNADNLKDSHAREERAIAFYRKAATEAKNQRAKQVFEALVEVETDHLSLSEERMRR